MTASNLAARFAQSRVALAVLGVMSLGLAGFLVTAGVVAYVKSLPAGAALQVGERVVTVDELEARGRDLRAFYGMEAPPSGSRDHDRYQRELARSMAIGAVVRTAARDRGIAATEQEADVLLAEFVQERFPEGRSAFAAALAQSGSSEPAMLDEIRFQATTGRLFEDVTAGVPPVTDEEVRRAYEAGKDALVVPEQRRLRNIVVSSEATAQAVRAEIEAGADFAAVARERSLDGSSRQAGGDLGLVPQAVLEEPFAQAAFAPEPGGLFGPVRSRHGWNVGQVVEIVPSRPLAFDEVRDDLRNRLDQARAMDAWRSFVDERVEKAEVTYAPDFTPLSPAWEPSSAPEPEPTARHSAPEGTPATPPAATVAAASSPLGATAFAIVQLVVAVALVLVGLWAWRSAGELAPATLPAAERARRARVYRRGAVACLVVGAVFVVAVVVSLVG